MHGDCFENSSSIFDRGLGRRRGKGPSHIGQCGNGDGRGSEYITSFLRPGFVMDGVQDNTKYAAVKKEVECVHVTPAGTILVRDSALR